MKLNKIYMIGSMLLAGTSAFANDACLTKVTNNIEGYYFKPVTVATGYCANANGQSITCPTQLNYGETVYFIPNGTNWDTVLSASVYNNSGANTGSFRIQVQNATSSCNPKVAYSDYCSTNPSSGTSDCSYTWDETSGDVNLQMN